MKKCDKFKEYFLFYDEEKLQEHINECPDCKEEYMKFQKVSSLVKEVRFAYNAKRKNSFMVKVACISACVMLTASFGIFQTILENNEYINYSNYLQESVTEEMGFPTDSYGLIKVD